MGLPAVGEEKPTGMEAEAHSLGGSRRGSGSSLCTGNCHPAIIVLLFLWAPGTCCGETRAGR